MQNAPTAQMQSVFAFCILHFALQVSVCIWQYRNPRECLAAEELE
jgi:hypothetical protein